MGPGCQVSLFAVVSDDKRVQVQPVEVPARLGCDAGIDFSGPPMCRE